MANFENIEKHKFKKGESGNPAGRPVGSRNRSTIVREWLEVKKQTRNPITEQDEELQVQDMMVLSMIGRALKGDVNAFKELMDSGYGKLLNYNEVTGKDGEGFIIQIVEHGKSED